MTSTILSSKEFKPLFKWAFRRNRTIMIIFSILLGLGLILNVYEMGINSYYDEDAVPITLAVYEAGAAFFTFISALKTFSFLHNKRSVDMFGALPTNRTTMFISHLLAGMSAIALPFTVGSIIIMAIATRSGESFKLGVFMIFTSLLMIAAAYTFTALIAYCCGTVVDTAIVTIAANGIWVGMIGLYFGLLSEIIPGYEFVNILYSPIFPAFAPYGFSIADITYHEEGSEAAVISNIVWQLIFTAGIFCLTIYVSKHRKAESSQNGFAFAWLPMVIKAGASVVAGAFIGFIAAETADSGYTNMYIFAFWYVIIGFVAFFVLHLIFARGLKGKFIPQAIVFGSTSVAALVLVFSMTYGMGIDTYVPSSNSVKSVNFDYCTFTEPENIELVTEIHKLVADGIKDSEGYPYYIGYEYDYYSDYDYISNGHYYTDDGEDVTEQIEHAKKDYSYVNSASFDFNYKKKFGFSTCRSYYISGTGDDTLYYDLDTMNELVKQLHASTEYKKSRYPNLFDEELLKSQIATSGQLTYMRYTDSYGNYSSIGHASLPSDEEFLKGLLDALTQDILADNSPDNSTEGKLGEEFIQLDITYRLINSKTGTTQSYRGTSSTKSNTTTYTIKESYKNTLDYIDKNADIKRIDKPESFDYDLYYSSYSDFGYSGDYYDLWRYIDDAAVIWEYDSCKNAGVEDYSKWHDDNYNSYVETLKIQAKKLYDEYIDDEKYFSDSYTNDYLRENDGSGYYFQLEDAIIEELQKYSDNYVKDTLTKADDTASDKKGSDIDSSTDSETKSKAESSSDKDVGRRTVSAARCPLK